MEDRLNKGVALGALVAIAVITAAWWALALHPVGPATPDWLARTQAVCFGTEATGLPSAGGWILLIGEPLGMLAALSIVWGSSLKRDLRWLVSGRVGRLAATAGLVLVAVGVLTAARRVQGALGHGAERFDAVGGETPVERPGTKAPPLNLVDQHGERFDLARHRGGPVIVTFAFAHCATVCPTVVHDVRAARRDAGMPDAPIVVVTLDPWRDVPSRLPHIAREWQLAEGDRVLSGSVEEVNGVLDAWQVPRSRDLNTGDVTHATIVLVVDGEGRVEVRMQDGFYRLRGLLPRV